MLFSAVPIVFAENRGWKPVPASLPFLAVLLGCLFAAAINVVYSASFYAKRADRVQGPLPPELRCAPPLTSGRREKGLMGGQVAADDAGLDSIPDRLLPPRLDVGPEHPLVPLGTSVHLASTTDAHRWAGQFLGLFFVGMAFLLIFQAGLNFAIVRPFLSSFEEGGIDDATGHVHSIRRLCHRSVPSPLLRVTSTLMRECSGQHVRAVNLRRGLAPRHPSLVPQPGHRLRLHPSRLPRRLVGRRAVPVLGLRPPVRRLPRDL